MINRHKTATCDLKLCIPHDAVVARQRQWMIQSCGDCASDALPVSIREFAACTPLLARQLPSLELPDTPSDHVV